MEMIVRGNDLRTMSPTEANATSSRSHAVLQINVSSKDRNASVNEPHTMATLSIIDLAGSERASATKNRGARLTEGANINKSLLALGSCINALCDARKHNHIPYRNSKLTRLLKFSLGGNCKTVMIVCVSPSSVHFDETQNTLRYANRAKNIQTKVTKNVFNVNRHVKDYLKKIDEQRALIDELMKKQKDSDGASLAKFQKQNDKKEGIMRDAFIRLRQAYSDSETDRRDRLNTMRTLKYTEKRISLVSAWVAAFDTVNDMRENEDMPTQVTAMRDTAIGISAELEQSRQHHHRRLERSTWASKLDTALSFGLRQLAEIDGNADGPDAANLNREYQLLKTNAEREVLSVLLEQEKGGDAATVQVLVQAHIETVTILSQITQMDEAQAVETARKLLTKIMNACTSATAQVIRPDGGLPVTEFFAPSHRGTPKRRKPVNVMGPSPVKSIPMPSFADAPHLTSSPMKASPRRKKPVAVKKGVQFSPVKKRPTSPSKAKRGVRWRDDNENGTLADFKTPEHVEGTPTTSSIELPPPIFSTYVPEPTANEAGSSPIPAPPTTSLDIKPRSGSSRFAAGFLTKKADASPMMSARSAYGSDSDTSPLREIGTNTVRPSALSNVELAQENSTTTIDNSANSSAAEEDHWSVDRSEANQIRTAIKRRSSTTKNAVPVNRTHRQRSPSTTSSSPPNENSISASAARRMVKNNHDGEWKPSVLSPRSAPVMKGAARRTTVAVSGEDRPREAGTLNRAPIRVVSNSSVRGSLAPGAKGVWR
jgi:kinesin family protein 18/19